MSLDDHTYATAIIDSQKVHKRKAADFYPTPPDVTQALLDYLQLPSNQFIWEPACGDGKMARVLEGNGHDVASTDLRPDSGYGIGGVDFLKADAEHIGCLPPTKPEWVITNPPFHVAELFIRHALTLADNVAMLLKSQFWHAKRREPLFRECRPSHVLALTWRPAFLEAERGRSPLMDVSWVVWRAGHASPTTYEPLLRPKAFKMAPESSDNRSASGALRSDIDDLFGDLMVSETSTPSEDVFGELG